MSSSAPLHRPTGTRRRLMAAAGLVVAVLASGCRQGRLAGYGSEELFPADLATVAVDIVANRSFYREVEFDLTEALIKEIELRSPYKVVASHAADSALTATIVSVDQRVVSRSFSGGLPQEVKVTVAMSFEWKDLRNGRVLRKRDRVVGVGTYSPTGPMNQPFAPAQHSAVADLAREVVSVMRSDW